MPVDYPYMYKTINEMKLGIIELLNNKKKREEIVKSNYNFWLKTYEEEIEDSKLIQNNEEKFEEAKYNVYEKFIGEYTADSYLDFSEDWSVPFLGSKYEGMESIIFKKDSLIFNKKEK